MKNIKHLIGLVAATAMFAFGGHCINAEEISIQPETAVVEEAAEDLSVEQESPVVEEISAEEEAPADMEISVEAEKPAEVETSVEKEASSEVIPPVVTGNTVVL